MSLAVEGRDLVAEGVHAGGELHRLAPQWRALVEQTRATPFQSAGWLLPWWRVFGSGDLCAVAVRDGRRLVALAPLYVFRTAGGSREVRLIGTGNTDRLDVIAAPQIAAEAAQLVFRCLADRDDWDAIELSMLPAGSPLLSAALPDGWRREVTPCAVCPIVALPSSVAAFEAALKPSLRHVLNNGRHRAARLGVRWYTEADRPPVDLLNALIRLHEARWEERGAPGVLHDPRVQAFHREAVEALALERRVRLTLMRLDGTDAAVFYGFTDGRTGYAYLGGFAPEFGAIGAGTLVIGETIRRLIDEGVRTFDFLAGQEAYKYRWGAVDETLYRARITRHGTRGRPRTRSPRGLLVA
ncbi:MAG TPA: GNAT family N-acetyltransferase [Vicinamibacterales bacterium]|nr:GNAT family N-acetyltransferase [Vicinamibacterales bacterium]